jgi:hypothetical protein
MTRSTVSAVRGVVILLVAAVVAFAATFAAGRAFLPSDRWMNALEAGRGSGLLPTETLVTAVRGDGWRAMVDTDEAHGLLDLRGRPDLENWQAFGVRPDEPFHLTLSFEGSETVLRVEARSIQPRVVQSERTLVTLTLPEGRYEARDGECSVELLDFELHTVRGRAFAVQNHLVSVPAFVGWLECREVPSRDGATALTFRAAFAYDPR